MWTQSPRSAADALRDCSLPFLRHLQVTETDEEIVLSGRVGTYYYKQWLRKRSCHRSATAG